VPLVIAAPGLITHQTRSRQVVSLIDVAPTLLDLLGGPVPRAYEGHSMLDGTSRMAFFYTHYSRPLCGLRDGRFKMIAELDSGRSRLFDLDADPGELSDIAEKHPDRRAWYARNLRNWSAANAARHP
jgi:lipoteichoic acid synthase